MTACCWWDCNPFDDTLSYKLPVGYNRKRRQLDLIGHFCSPNCVKAFIIHESPNKWQRLDWFRTYCRKYLGVTTHVQQAPYRYKLKMFLGDLSITEFRKDFIYPKKDVTYSRGIEKKKKDISPPRQRRIKIGLEQYFKKKCIE